MTDANMAPVNRYADLALNPNRRPDGDFDCWIGNREQTRRLPIDPDPPPGNEMADMLSGLATAFDSPEFMQKLRVINGLGSDADIVSSVWDLLLGQSGFSSRLSRLTGASDLIDVGLDTFLTPTLTLPDGPAVAQGALTGILSGLLSTANPDMRSDKTGVSVGALGFPAAGVMGTGLEVALSPGDAFGFLVTEILDKVDEIRPFLGYVLHPRLQQDEDPDGHAAVRRGDRALLGNDRGRRVCVRQQPEVHPRSPGENTCSHTGGQPRCHVALGT